MVTEKELGSFTFVVVGPSLSLLGPSLSLLWTSFLSSRSLIMRHRLRDEDDDKMGSQKAPVGPPKP
eukprot:1674996-Pyramimonas_sp.AAC.1